MQRAVELPLSQDDASETVLLSSSNGRPDEKIRVAIGQQFLNYHGGNDQGGKRQNPGEPNAELLLLHT
jgi:hypothetical protein